MDGGVGASNRRARLRQGMARKPRVELAGGVHHVFARGNCRQLIYLNDADRGAYLDLLACVVVRKRWHCLAFCLMDNHVHLLIETPLPNLGAGMQWLHGRFAQGFNRRHRRTGHVFEGRFGSVLVKNESSSGPRSVHRSQPRGGGPVRTPARLALEQPRCRGRSRRDAVSRL